MFLVFTRARGRHIVAVSGPTSSSSSCKAGIGLTASAACGRRLLTSASTSGIGSKRRGGPACRSSSARGGAPVRTDDDLTRLVGD